MTRSSPGLVRHLLAAASLAAGLSLCGCNGRTVMAPASAPSPDAKPALAAPPASMMTPHGY